MTTGQSSTTHILRILHMSDLHERCAIDGMDRSRKIQIRLALAEQNRVLGDALTRVLQEISADRKIDIFCFTGDIADWGLKEEYANAGKRLTGILKEAGVGADHSFFVPGNHDVRRNTNVAEWSKMRQLMDRHEREVSQWIAGGSVPAMLPGIPSSDLPSMVLERTAGYRDWLADIGRHGLLPSSAGHERLGYVVQCNGRAFPTHVIGLDSAWLCGDDNDSGKIRLTRSQIDLLTRGIEGEPHTGFRVALMHHPLEELADRGETFRLLSDTVDLLLHGHQHEPVAQQLVDPSGKLLVIAAGSLFEGTQGDRWLNEFNVIDVHLNDQGRPLCYDLYFWGWSSHGRHWYRTGAIYEAARTGHLHIVTPLGKEDPITVGDSPRPGVHSKELPAAVDPPQIHACFQLDGRGKPATTRKGHYKINLTIDKAPPATTSVTYHLHSSYYEPVRVSRQADAAFVEEITSYGDYKIRARVQLDQGYVDTSRKLADALKASYGSDMTPEIAQAIADIREN